MVTHNMLRTHEVIFTDNKIFVTAHDLIKQHINMEIAPYVRTYFKVTNQFKNREFA